LLAGRLDGRNECAERRYRVQRIPEALPLVKAAAQRAHALDPQFVQLHGGLGRGGLAGAGAVEHHIAVAGNLKVARGDGIGREMHRTGERERVGHELEGVAQVDDVDLLACIKLLL